MPADLTIFAASSVVFLEALAVAVIVLALLYRAPRADLVRWGVACGVMILVASVAAQIGGALYTDPRPFVVGHYRPLIAHVADNGFPSDHALMAAALVAAVALVRVRWAMVVLPLAIVVEWARVGAGLHHPIDVVGSDLCVAFGVLVAVVVARPLTRIVLPYVPGRFLDLVTAPAHEQTIA